MSSTVESLNRQIIACFGVPSAIFCHHPAESLWRDRDGVLGCDQCGTALEPEPFRGSWAYNKRLVVMGIIDPPGEMAEQQVKPKGTDE